MMLALASPAGAQSAGGPAASPQAPAAEDARPARKSRKRDGAAKRELTVKGMAASERRKKCGAEWKEAKAAGKTEGVKWPKFYSQCNARLKGDSV
jgi:hypothetical protein